MTDHSHMISNRAGILSALWRFTHNKYRYSPWHLFKCLALICCVLNVQLTIMHEPHTRSGDADRPGPVESVPGANRLRDGSLCYSPFVERGLWFGSFSGQQEARWQRMPNSLTTALPVLGPGTSPTYLLLWHCCRRDNRSRDVNGLLKPSSSLFM